MTLPSRHDLGCRSDCIAQNISERARKSESSLSQGNGAEKTGHTLFIRKGSQAAKRAQGNWKGEMSSLFV